ncbi:hypothetical protein J2Z79_002640 [Symbiobacterium terraclitae]|uniref:DUF4912 domain-containing protein n=1 Tax=Symbiobacterium terraclitae TaxID=557451 RepID=A0ABS4JW66_9FIRM|nr:DUF4912 domain-containing protein [Symbiobacterium terraclitae]MBP2019215.1 hypothetical protein [Symbiobacterium terraclitae]
MEEMAILGVIGLGCVALGLYLAYSARPRTRPRSVRSDRRKYPRLGAHPSTLVPPMEVSGPLDPDPVQTPEADRWRALTEEIPFPSAYGEDAVVALIRTPRSAYVYWERSGGAEQQLRRRLGEEGYAATVPVLRVWEGGRLVRTIRLHEHDDHWFLHDGLEPGRHYTFTYERLAPDGRSWRICRSNPIAMPYDTPGARTPEMLYRYLGGDRPGAVAGSIQRR